jgi:hypothetical protein
MNNPNVETRKCQTCDREFPVNVLGHFWGCPECGSQDTIVTKEALISGIDVRIQKLWAWHSQLVKAGRLPPVPVHTTRVHDSDLWTEINGPAIMKSWKSPEERES